MKTYFIGEGCLCWSLGDSIDKEISERILSIYRRLKAMPSLAGMGVLDLVPSYNALAVHYDPATVRLDEMKKTVGELFEEIEATSTDSSSAIDVPGKTIVIPVKYTGEDLNRVAEINGLSVSEVIQVHQEPDYTVAMVGFLPHFPYMIGLDPRLVTPRLDSPRTKVPAGAVGIGGAQAGVYPSESPGGWNLIGETDPELLIPIEPGDTIRFKEA